MLAEELHWTVAAKTPKRFMKRIRQGRYEGVCKDGSRVRIDLHDGEWELYMGQEFIGKWPMKRTALKKANALLTSDKCDEDKSE